MTSLTRKIKALVAAWLFALILLPDSSSPCDTWVALPDATSSGYTILGKNSDRLNFDCQPLLLHPRKKWPAGSVIDLGRITIPQVEETYATLGSSPYWCWGYEEGINEFGVAIGNEGIRTTVLLEELAARTKSGPTGMDLLRLGLERGRTAREALDKITDLLEKYGQFGSGLPTLPDAAGAYHNSYIIADPKEAWILETAGTLWAARRVPQGVASISNTLSIEKDWDLVSDELKGSSDLDFTKTFLDEGPMGANQRRLSLPRAECSANLLLEKQGNVDPRWMMRVARDRSSTPAIDGDVTASSCVAVLPHAPDELPVFWWCASTPSNSCYIPFFVHGGGLPEIVSKAGTFGRRIMPPDEAEPDSFSKDSFWWLFRDLCDLSRIAYGDRNPVIRAEFDLLEKEFEAGIPALMDRALSLRTKGRAADAAKILDDYSAACVAKAVKKVDELRVRFKAEVAEVPDQYKPYVGRYIANFGQFRNAAFTVLVQNDRLAVDVPGQRVYELKDPDDEGKWYFALTDEIALSFDQEDDGRVTGMKMYQAGMTLPLPREAVQEEETEPAAEAEAESITLERRLGRLAKQLEEKRKEFHIPGMAVAVVRGDEVIMARGFGYADLENKKPVKPETLFAIGSTTKAFTAALVGMLVDDGKLDWDDPVTRYLPYFTLKVDSKDESAEVTIRDLLSHRTGFTRMGLLFESGAVPREEILRTAKEAEPWTGFREKFYYNNIMYLAAGMAAGDAVGKDWDTLIVERILNPLGMKDSNISVSRCKNDGRLAKGYQWEEDRRAFRRLAMRTVDNVGPAGSINSNVLDMAKWVRFQLRCGTFEGKRLISEESLRETRTKQTDIAGGVGYGLGWMLREWEGQPLIEHGGNIDGFAAQVAFLPESDLGYVMLCNVTGTLFQQLSMGLVCQTMLGDWDEDEAEVVATDFTPYLGEYNANFGPFKDVKFTVLEKDGGLALDVPGQMVYKLKPPDEEGKWRFVISDQVAVSFVRDDSGRVIAMNQYQAGVTLELPKIGVDLPPEVPLDELQKYLGRYHSYQMDETLSLVIKNNCLALAIPGQKTYELRAPDEEGKWRFRVLDRIAVSFKESDDGQVLAFTYYEGEGKLTYLRVDEEGAEPPPSLDRILALRKPDQRKAALDKLGACRFSGTVRVSQSGVTGAVDWYVHGPGRHRQELTFDKYGRILSVVNHEQAWTKTPYGRVDELRGKFHELASHQHPAALFGDWRDFFESVLFLRVDKLDGKNVYVLKLKSAEAPDYTVYTDARTGDVLKAETEIQHPGSMTRIFTTTLFEDFREVQGIRIPFRVIVSDEWSGRMVIQFDKLSTDIDIDDKIFTL